MSKAVIFESPEKQEEKIEAKSDWQPNLKVVQEFKAEIIESYTAARGVYNLNNELIFPTPPTRFMDQYAKIGAFLRDSKATIKQLNILNDLLIQEIKEQKYDEYHPPVRVLRDVLEKELAKFGFQPKFGKVHDFLPAGRFRETIRMGLLLKDPGANANSPHGDYTHAIQWWMIARQHQDTQFLAAEGLTPESTVIEIFKSLGEDAAVFFSEKQTITGLSVTERSIWDNLVDAQGDFSHGFCTPEELNKFLYNGGASSLLQTLTWERAQKRARENKKLPKISNQHKPSKRTRYSLFSALPLQLPKLLVADETSKIAELELFVENKDDDPLLEQKTKKSEEIDISYFDSFATKAHDGEYKQIIQQLSEFVGNTKLSEPVLQNCHFYLGLSYLNTNQIKLAEFHMRKAYQLSPASGSKESKDFIREDEVRKELGKSQYILRVTAPAEKEVTDEISSRRSRAPS